MSDKNIHDISQSDISLNENPIRNTFLGNDDEIKLQKAWMEEMPTNNGDILTTTMSGLEQANRDYKKFLYARVTHSNDAIQYHMQQIIEKKGS